MTDFLRESASSVVGKIVIDFPHELQGTQKEAWQGQIAHLKDALADFSDGYVAFEFQIPRVGRRVDVVLLLRGVVFVLEYKVGQATYDRVAVEQVTDYALDLKNFHGGSHVLPIVPILIATRATARPVLFERDSDGVYLACRANLDTLGSIIRSALEEIPGETLDPVKWLESPYRPTPTIVEAATVLYETHSVEDISRSDAAENLSTTSFQVTQLIRDAEQRQRKVICFITGVPGAGKTLAGLHIATERQKQQASSRAVFLSGNDPLVRVLREALARDQVRNERLRGRVLKISAARQKTQVFIQNIRHFRDDTYNTADPPHEHVVVFDEAQRAWRREQLQSFMKRKRSVPDFAMSEPQFLLSVMDRHDWCCVVCLVGGGQEINTGEAGIGEWLSTLESHSPHWDVYYSKQLTGLEYDWNGDLESRLSRIRAIQRPGLHLSISLRSFRAERLSDFVRAVVDGTNEDASKVLAEIPKYPIVMTRDLGLAQDWVRRRARGTERFGLLASSGALRLRPDGVTVKLKAEPEHWFLDDSSDVRSSSHLEDVATEFDVQGLELDWAIVCWDADLRFQASQWVGYKFAGSRWQAIRQVERQRYLLNAYRVLLTRSRQGFAIFVPRGDQRDVTRLPAWYDSIYSFLRSCGIPELE